MMRKASYVTANRMWIADGYPERKGWNWPKRTAALRLGTRNPNAMRTEPIPYRESLFTPKPMLWAGLDRRLRQHLGARRVTLDVWSRFKRGKQRRA